MNERLLTVLTAAGLLAISPVASPAQATATSPTAARPRQSAAVGIPERPVRRDIPMTDMIRRAFAAGTRDASGRPGPRYW